MCLAHPGPLHSLHRCLTSHLPLSSCCLLSHLPVSSRCSPQASAFVEGLFVHSRDHKLYKSHVRDFLIDVLVRTEARDRCSLTDGCTT